MKFNTNLSDRSFFSKLKRLRALSPLLIVLVVSTSCKTVDQLTPEPTPAVATPIPTPTPITTPTPSQAASSSAELYFKLDAAWDSGTSYAAQAPYDVDGVVPMFPTQDACKITIGTAPSVGHTCTFNLPENQLYFSKLKMTVGSSDSSCAYVRFYPYFYRGEGPVSPPAVAGAPTPVPFFPTWAVDGTTTLPLAPVSCLSFVPGLPIYNDVTTTLLGTSALAGEMAPNYATAACYNGAATKLAGFPLVKYVSIQTGTAQELVYPLVSANSMHQLSNRWAANDFPATTLGFPGRLFTGYPANFKEYASDSANDYVAQCLDQFGQIMYETKIVITAKSNVAGASASNYLTWKPAPAVVPTATPIPTATPTPTAVPPSPTPSPAPASVYSEMYFTLEAAWDSGSSYTLATPYSVDGVTAAMASDSCKISYGTLAGGGTGLGHTCTYYVPDTQLYFSKLRMKMGSSDPVGCKYVKFYPYYYTIQASAAPGDPVFTPTPAPVTVPWVLPAGPSPLATATCFGFYAGTVFAPDLGVPASQSAQRYSTQGCYNGPATSISGFPYVKSVNQETSYNQELSFNVNSANLLNQASSRYASNDLAAGSRGSSFMAGIEYYPSSMHDYVVQCIDANGNLNYETKITISGGSLATPAAVYKTWR
jgi:hypothetical protein